MTLVRRAMVALLVSFVLGKKVIYILNEIKTLLLNTTKINMKHDKVHSYTL